MSLARFLALPLLAAANVSLIACPQIAECSWPKFQGPNERGDTPSSLPLRWTSSDDMAWTSVLPGYGQSSPVIWGDLVVLTSIDGPEKETGIVVCLDKQTGEVRWPSTGLGQPEELTLYTCLVEGEEAGAPVKYLERESVERAGHTHI